MLHYVITTYYVLRNSGRRYVWSSSPGGGTSRRPHHAALLVTRAKSAIFECLVQEGKVICILAEILRTNNSTDCDTHRSVENYDEAKRTWT